MNYEPVIGLEVHAELKTKTKMFCPCINEASEKHPNINICPICTGHPGTLPTMNQRAVELVLKMGMAVGGEIPLKAKFDRKNYFYPDLPKAYQISQYDLPLIFNGILNDIHIRRIHLEEDAGKLLHNDHDDDSDGKDHSSAYSLVDYNRASAPLMELVTEPEIYSADQAVEFTKELQLILRYLGISDADMESGHLRLEANISIRALNPDTQLPTSNQLGTKVEVKNLNSFKALLDAVEYEVKRQAALLDGNEVIVQETRGWDDKKQETFSQRSKEEANDYRYFPEPDLPPLDLSLIDLSRLKAELVELPNAKRQRFIKEYGLLPEQAMMLILEPDWSRYFEEAVSELLADNPDKKNISLLFNYLTTDLKGLLMAAVLEINEVKLSPAAFADLIQLIASGKLTSRLAKDILKKMIETGLDAHAIMQQDNIVVVSDAGALEKLAADIIKNNPKAVEDYKKGKSASLQFLVGQAMRVLKGQGDPAVLQEVFTKLLKQ